MNYSETISFLFESLPMFQRTGAAAYKNSLETTIALDMAHGHPHHSFKTIHIAGTNGKGSVSHTLASILQVAGYKTGLYTSPHLLDFRERIRINGKMISKKAVVDYVRTNKKLIQELKPSFFEMTVDLAFSYFKNNNTDIAVIETGMGGRLDSTNIVTPVLSVITNIGLDHTRFLGNSIGEIAREKAGIIKKNIPLVIGEFQKESYPVFEEFAMKNNITPVLADKIIQYEYSLWAKDRKVYRSFHSDLQKYSKMRCDLQGDYQVKNLKTVLACYENLVSQGFIINLQHLRSGIARVKQNTGLKGRWEEISFNPLCICDTAHNEDGVKEIISQIKNTPHRNLHMVWGMVSDKDTRSILKLLPGNARYYFTKAAIPRSLDERLLFDQAREAGLKGEAFRDVGTAFLEAKKNAGTDDLIFIGGSTFVVAELLEFIGRK